MTWIEEDSSRGPLFRHFHVNGANPTQQWTTRAKTKIPRKRATNSWAKKTFPSRHSKLSLNPLRLLFLPWQLPPKSDLHRVRHSSAFFSRRNFRILLNRMGTEVSVVISRRVSLFLFCLPGVSSALSAVLGFVPGAIGGAWEHSQSRVDNV